MSKNSRELISAQKNLTFKIDVSKVTGQENWLAKVEINQYDPKNFIPNGGPLTLKACSFAVLGKSYDDAYGKGLDEACVLMGFGE